MPAREYVIDSDVLYPRVPAERFRLYGRRGDELDVLGTCASMDAVGTAIETLHEDAKAVGGDFGDYGQFGLLDAILGEWIVKPYTREAT